MEEPAQSIAGGDFLQPKIDLRALARQAARPQPIHQDADAVRRVRRLIDALDAQVLRVISGDHDRTGPWR